MQYDSRVNERQNQTTEEKTDTSNVLDARKTFASSTTKVESEPPNGSNADITNQCESKQALNVSAGTLLSTDQASVFMAMTSDHNRSELRIHDHSNEPSSSKLVPKVVPLAVKTATSRQELESLFHLHIAMLRTTGPSDEITNPFLAIRVSLNRNLSHLSRRYTRYLLTSHFEIVDIE
ncbi:hypothetical protein Tco_0158363 [Tanacetum coccineum]